MLLPTTNSQKSPRKSAKQASPAPSNPITCPMVKPARRPIHPISSDAGMVDSMVAVNCIASGTVAKDLSMANICPANAEIVMVEELLSEEDTSWMEPDVKASIESSLSQLKAAVAGDDTGVILSALENMVTAMQALPEEGQGSTGLGDDGSMQEVLADAHAEIDVARNTMESNAEYITPEDMAIIEGGISDLQGVMDGTDREAIYAAIMSLAGILEALQFEGTDTTSTGSTESTGSSASTPLTFVNIQCPPMVVVGQQMGCSFSYDGMLESHEWTAVFSGDGSQISSDSQLFTATYDQLGTVSLNLTACDANSCLQASHTIEIVEPKKNGVEHTPDDQGNQEGPQSGDQQGDHTGDQGNQK